MSKSGYAEKVDSFLKSSGRDVGPDFIPCACLPDRTDCDCLVSEGVQGLSAENGNPVDLVSDLPFVYFNEGVNLYLVRTH